VHFLPKPYATQGSTVSAAVFRRISARHGRYRYPDRHSAETLLSGHPGIRHVSASCCSFLSPPCAFPLRTRPGRSRSPRARPSPTVQRPSRPHPGSLRALRAGGARDACLHPARHNAPRRGAAGAVCPEPGAGMVAGDRSGSEGPHRGGRMLTWDPDGGEGCRAWDKSRVFGQALHIRCTPRCLKPDGPSATSNLYACWRCYGRSGFAFLVPLNPVVGFTDTTAKWALRAIKVRITMLGCHRLPVRCGRRSDLQFVAYGKNLESQHHHGHSDSSG